MLIYEDLQINASLSPRRGIFGVVPITFPPNHQQTYNWEQKSYLTSERLRYICYSCLATG